MVQQGEVCKLDVQARKRARLGPPVASDEAIRMPEHFWIPNDAHPLNKLNAINMNVRGGINEVRDQIVVDHLPWREGID